MKNTTLCYIEKDGAYLMLHRVKKENDENKNKWVGIGGKLESGESPFDCARREIKEETGLIAEKLEYRAIITFVSNIYATEYMHLFVCKEFKGSLQSENDEGIMKWIKIEDVKDLNLWEGDKIFLDAIKNPCPFFSLKLVYENDTLISYTFE